MKLWFLGTCSGTEPMEGRRHASFVLETNGDLYWFDAGEGCSTTAHLLGLDLLAVKRIVISHPHMDHVGGLANLLWTVRKLIRRTGRPFGGDSLNVHIPSLDTWDGVIRILRNSEGGFEIPFTLLAHRTVSGLLFDDGAVRVTAFPNEHIRPVNGEVFSYSFLIECEGQCIVYSGDIKRYTELDVAMEQGCDVLIAETGHHKPEDVCAYARKKMVKHLYFTHHGREILDAPALAAQKVCRLFGDGAVIAYDGMCVEL